jgi:corrinoid protein of di/trimethylamine methyltransferase
LSTVPDEGNDGLSAYGPAFTATFNRDTGDAGMEELFAKMAEALIAAKAEEVNKLVEEALNAGGEAKNILDNGLIPGMDVVGQRMKTGEMFIPEVLRSAKAMQGAMELLQTHMSGEDAIGRGTVVMGTVEGDLHDIGKNLVSMMLQGAGFKVVDLGTNIKPMDFVEAVKSNKAAILGMSALLTTTMPKMEETIEALKEAGIRDQVKVMLGGAPVTQKFTSDIGADAYGANAASATDRAKELMG